MLIRNTCSATRPRVGCARRRCRDVVVAGLGGRRRRSSGRPRACVRREVDDDRADARSAAARRRWPTRSRSRLASPMMLLVTSTDSSSRPLRPLLMMNTRSNARSDSMTVMTRITMLIGRRTGNTTRKKVWRSLAPSIAAASRRLGRRPSAPPGTGPSRSPTWRQLAATSTAHRLMLELPSQSMRLPCSLRAQDAVDETLGRASTAAAR